MSDRLRFLRWTASTLGLACLFTAASTHAATLCVDTHAKSGCYTSINAAVSAASPGDTIEVASGTYAEDVHVTKPLSLVGQNRENTIIAANGLNNGIYIDGFNNPGLAHVNVSGFTVENADFEGILAQNVSDVTIFDNILQGNDQNLKVTAQGSSCPGLPAFETNEGEDCGEALHLMGVDHSIVSGNLIEHNAAGILISDETAPNHDNAITHNTVVNNPYECGITLASHKGYVANGTAPLAFGVMHNTVADNESRNNGGAGVGIFAPGPGTSDTLNSIVGNRLVDNAHPGVEFHNHAYLTFPNHPPNPNINDNTVTGNYIAGNGADDGIPTSASTGISVLGVTPVTGLLISGNIIQKEDIDIAVSSASVIDVHLNSLQGKKIGAEELNAGGTLNATENWWGCPKGPGANGCATTSGNVLYTPWLETPPVDELLHGQ